MTTKKITCSTKNILLFLSFLFLSPSISTTNAEPSSTGIAWKTWDELLFKEAAKTKRLVILNLEAVWCHWCHVMEAETYSNPEVQGLIAKHFIPIKVDQDFRPDLGNKYKDWGWPATIIFNENGVELAKRAGFIEPQEMISLLDKTAKNPSLVLDDDNSTEEFITPTSAALSLELKEKLLSNYYSSMDKKLGGLKTSHKFIDSDTMEFLLLQAMDPSKSEDKKFALLTLDNNLKLIDPVWGGVYQYSTHRDWEHPHFEKIMSSQSNNLRIYSLAYQQFKDPRYLQAAQEIRRYLSRFLTSPSGAFYTSQDADVIRGQHSDSYFSLNDAARLKIGIPAVDKHVYARENGWAIHALTILYTTTLDEALLKQAIQAANWIVNNRRLHEGGFRHDEVDPAGPYLGDSLAMGRALLGLYGTTGERKWLQLADETAGFIWKNFYLSTDKKGGYHTARAVTDSIIPVAKLTEENIVAARFFNLLSHYLGKNEYKSAADEAMKFLASSSVALATITEPGILLADSELSSDPLHITIVGAKSDSSAKLLFTSAISHPTTYKRIEWFDRTEGPLPNPDVQYPQLKQAAAFICTNKRCSLPIFKAEDIAPTVKQLTQNKTN